MIRFKWDVLFFVLITHIQVPYKKGDISVQQRIDPHAIRGAV